jgi:hypothetical protein
MLIEDNKFLQKIDGDCESKKVDWDERQKMRAEELNAIHQTVQILNDDTALDLFKKTLPNVGSLLQVKSKAEFKKVEIAISILRQQRQAHVAIMDGPSIHFLETVLMGGKVDFAKVFKLIDDMITLLEQEQVDDDQKVEYCNTMISKVEDKTRELTRTHKDVQASLDQRSEILATLSDEIRTLHKEVAQLDKLVSDATYDRKSQNEEYRELMSSNNAAKELLQFAKDRLNKFYNPTQFAQTSKHNLPQDTEELTELGSPAALYKVLERPPSLPARHRRATQVESPVATSASLLQGASFQIAAHASNRDDPGAPPPTFGSTYQKKADSTSSVISMIDLLIRDLTKEVAEAEKDEEHAQKEYESFMDDSAAKRAQSLKNIHTAETSKADIEELKVKEEGEFKANFQELEATKIYAKQVHTDCDWLLQNHDLRKTAREDESDNLKKAKAVLKGADFSAMQTQQPKSPTVFLSRA